MSISYLTIQEFLPHVNLIMMRDKNAKQITIMSLLALWSIFLRRKKNLNEEKNA